MEWGTEKQHRGGEAAPDLSLVMPCYNEEEAVGYTIPRLVDAFQRAGYVLQLVAVNNGSTDGTEAELQRLAREWPQVQPERVEVNEGYGNGILQGFPHCRAPWVGYIPADGQIDAEDVVRLYEAARATSGLVVAKARRRFRLDGFLRKVVSVSYNVFARLLWPRLGSIDVNGTPKLFRRELLEQLDLQSRDWLLDPELMIKAHYLGARVMEFNVFGRMRGTGLSHVRASTCVYFFVELLRLRLSRRLPEWRRTRRATAEEAAPVLASSRE